MGKVKTQALWTYVRSGLGRVLAQNLPECSVQEMCRRMVAGNVQPALSIDLGDQFVTHRQRALSHDAMVYDEFWCGTLRICHEYGRTIGDEHTLVAYLAPRLSIKGRSVKHHRHLITG